ncbi:hypothetical protein [Nocardia sp. X0981]
MTRTSPPPTTIAGLTTNATAAAACSGPSPALIFLSSEGERS